MQILFPSVTAKLPNMSWPCPHYTSTDLNSSFVEALYSDHDASPTTEQPAISRSSLGHRSINSKISVPRELNSSHAVYPLSVTTGQSVTSRSSTAYNSTDSKSSILRDRPTQWLHRISSPVSPIPSISRPSPKYKSTGSKNCVPVQVQLYQLQELCPGKCSMSPLALSLSCLLFQDHLPSKIHWPEEISPCLSITPLTCKAQPRISHHWLCIYP